MDSTTIKTPLGAFSVAVKGDVVVASSWTDDVDSMLRRAIGGRTAHQRRRDLGAISRAAQDYFEGDLTAVDAIPVAQHHGPFLNRVLTILRTVPAGTVVSYADLAILAGNPGAARAAGTACARNNVPLFVPCHRVIRSDGSIGEFGFGVDAKQWLLDHEAASGYGRQMSSGRTGTRVRGLPVA